MKPTSILMFHRPGRALAALLLAGLLGHGALWAQQVQDLHLTDAPPDMISATAPPSAPLAAAASAPATAAAGQTTPAAKSTFSLGQNLGEPAQNSAAPAGAVNPVASGGGIAKRAAQAAQRPPAKAGSRLRRADDGKEQALAPATGPVERATFEREPIRVPLPVGRERLVTLPTAAALHVPADMERVARIQNIDRTLYVTALTPFTPIRIVAELLDSGQQIPMDFVASPATASSTGELQVSVIEAHGKTSGQNQADGGAPAAAQAEGAPVSGVQTSGLDMVELTRYASHQLYAPRRLATRVAGVTQIGITPTALPSLIRGIDAEVMPMGQWKSGPLYVTAVRVTNRSRYPLEIPLEQLRGDWIAATAQHGRIGPAGSETDTTAIYLVSDRRFEACLP